MGYIHFRANGTMEPIVIDGRGVGSYDARDAIEAENFFSLLGGEPRAATPRPPVPYRYLPLPTVTYRYIPLHTVTYRRANPPLASSCSPTA